MLRAALRLIVYLTGAVLAAVTVTMITMTALFAFTDTANPPFMEELLILLLIVFGGVAIWRFIARLRRRDEAATG